MEYVTESKISRDLAPISVNPTPTRLEIIDPTILPHQPIRSYLIVTGTYAGQLVTCWNQDFGFILEACNEPNHWAGFYLGCQDSLPTLARLLANTARGSASDVRLFTMIDPDDNTRKWVIGKFIGAPDPFRKQLLSGVQLSPQKMPKGYQEVLGFCKSFMMEKAALASKGQSVFSKIKIGIKSQTSPPGMPMPSVKIFDLVPGAQSNRTDRALGRSTEVLETVVDYGEKLSGGGFESTASGLLGKVVTSTADHTAKPFDTQSEGHQKASRLMPIYLALLVVFALLAIASGSGKPIGIFILLIGVYNLISKKAILQTGASLAYYEGNKAQIIGLIELALGLVIVLFV